MNSISPALTRADQVEKSIRARQWRAARDAKIIALAKNGATLQQIADQIICASTTVSAVLRKQRGTRPVGRPGKTAPNAMDLLVIETYRNRKTMRETGKEVGRSLERVRQILRRWAPELIRARHVSKRQQGIA